MGEPASRSHRAVLKIEELIYFLLRNVDDCLGGR
jgi:hypothetical protein